MGDEREHWLKPGDTVVVTGGAQGIGRAICYRLARDGARVAVWDVDERGGTETAEGCRRLGTEAAFFRVDVGSADDVAEGTRKVRDIFGVPFGLVSNAGIFPRAPVLELSLETWDSVLRTNLTGCFLCSQSLGKGMVEQGRGAIVTIASGRALQGAVRGAAYAASKGGIIALTKSLALEWARHGVRVNCVIPGVTETAQPLQDTTREELLRRGATIPLGRIGQPEDIAAVVAFLLSRDAAYMTGQSVAVNGGSIMIP